MSDEVAENVVWSFWGYTNSLTIHTTISVLASALCSRLRDWVWRNKYVGTVLRMVSVLVWTTYVVAAVVVVLYGLAAGFVAFLRCAI